MASVVVGLAIVNATFALVGYAVLPPTLRRPASAGLALLLGAAAVGVALAVLAVLGLTVTLAAFFATAAVLAAAGAAAGLRRRGPPPTAAPEPPGLVAPFAAGAVAAIVVLLTVAAFRTSAWLDDAWTFWLPKGLLLTGRGLDPRPFSGSGGVLPFISPDYPLWWSLVGGVDTHAVGHVDLRALAAQDALFVAAFVAAAAQLLRRWVRPRILWPCLLVLTAAPEVASQALDGGADVPLAIYVSLAALAGLLWILEGERYWLVPAFLASAAAANLKSEGLPLLVLCLLVPALLVPQSRARAAPLAAVLVGALLTLVPWLAWRAGHGVSSAVTSASLVDPAHLARHVGRLSTSVHAVAGDLASPRRWLVVVPLFLAVSVWAAVVDRRPAWLAPALGIGLGLAFFAWIYWGGSIDLHYWTTTSAYRVVDTLALLAATATPLLAERARRVRRAS